MYNKYENFIISLILVNLLLHLKIKVIGNFILSETEIVTLINLVISKHWNLFYSIKLLFKL